GETAVSKSARAALLDPLFWLAHFSRVEFAVVGPATPGALKALSVIAERIFRPTERRLGVGRIVFKVAGMASVNAPRAVLIVGQQRAEPRLIVAVGLAGIVVLKIL